MKVLIKSIALALFLLSGSTAFSQVKLYRDTIIKVVQNNNVLNNGWGSGFNSPTFAVIDLNGDSRLDLISFETQTGRLNPFINKGGTQKSYVYAPEYRSRFPMELEGWVRTYDFDGDGDLDVFTYYNAGIRVYRNDYTPQFGLQFSLFNNQLQTHYGNFQTNIYVSRVNMPAIIDVDNDGDMDVLAFSIAGNFVEHHKNLSVDSTGNAAGFLFYNVPQCWGYFALSSFSNVGLLPVIPSCPLMPADPFRTIFDEDTEPPSPTRNRHAGSALLALDMDGDGDKDILNGDILSSNLLYLQNCGTPDSAYMCAEDTLFPSYNIPAIMSDVAGPYYFDANNDGNKDLIVANFYTGEDFANVRFYRNTTNNTTNQFSFVTDRFLTNEMIETGTGAHPAFLDVDGDGLKDLLIANDFYYAGNTNVAKVAYYRNSGTVSQAEYTFVTDNFSNIASLNLRNIYPTFGDLDNDGDKDMILGENTGSLLYFQNIGGSGAASFVLTQTNYQSIDVGDNAAPQLFDVDRDGLLDLVIGERTGVLNYYRNTGTNTLPVFTLVTQNFGGVSVLKVNSFAGYSAPLMFERNGNYELLVGSESGFLYHYNNIDGNLSGAFVLQDSMFQNIYEPVRATPAMTDVDGDGKYDLVIGNLSGGCVLYSQNTILSLNENDAEPFFNQTVYPNPSQGIVTIQLDRVLSQDGDLLISDLSGRILYRSTIRSQKVVDLSALSSGMYICNITCKDKSISELLIKQ